ncbi:uncharacterized protein LOC127898867 [Citrus sinensis]|uniref:uncharacterized protein LOC127898867 n=1 Tax=Citrus sinensis TaxID=2711 RepID=UPI002278E843|nr:uncharacterized protein LOC127898867 [Citrus sinensis]
MGWLGDEHIHEYLRLISEKQRQYPNALLQRVTHTDTFFWVFLNQLWNNGDCAVDSLVFDDRLNSYLCGRQHTMSKSMTDVDMLLIPVNLDGAHWVLARVDFRKNKILDGRSECYKIVQEITISILLEVSGCTLIRCS